MGASAPSRRGRGGEPQAAGQPDLAAFQRGALGSRVLVIGSPGSGKTWLTRRLATVSGLPPIHLDDHYWREGWARPSSTEWDRTLEGLLARPRWIIDGNYASSLPRRLVRSDSVILLDFPTLLCAASVVRRGMQRRLGARDSLPRRVAEDPAYTPQMRIPWRFLRLVLLFGVETRPVVQRHLALAHHVRVVRVPDRKGADRLLASLATERGSGCLRGRRARS